jgi:hypothetical protein
MMRELEVKVQGRVAEPREWEYNGVGVLSQLDSHGKLVVEEELEVSL